MDCSVFPGTKGPVDINLLATEPIVMQVWSYVKCKINGWTDKMKLVLGRFGVDKDLLDFEKI